MAPTLSLSALLPTPTTLLLRFLSIGPIPAHIAFVMDGNRRWATSHHRDVKEGHKDGFEALKRVLEMCLELHGLRAVSVYAFAIENFHRPREEVETLMGMAKTKLIEMCGHGELIARHNVRVKIVGARHLLPPDVRAAMEEVERITASHTGATLNICMPYASRDEMASAIRLSIQDKLIDAGTPSSPSPPVTSCPDPASTSTPTQTLTPTSTTVPCPPTSPSTTPITVQDIADHLQISPTDPQVDVLVRTSGVSRLSDFLLWQCNSTTQIHFVSSYWPSFGLRDLVPILLHFQREVWWRKMSAWWFAEEGDGEGRTGEGEGGRERKRGYDSERQTHKGR